MNSEQPSVVLALAEYSALRNESLQCSEMIGHAVWIGLTGFIVTVGGTAAALGQIDNATVWLWLMDEAKVSFAVLVVLMLQSIAATAHLVSQLFRFLRIGVYLREHYEEPLAPSGANASAITLIRPQWERHIVGQRSISFYVVSIGILQLPLIPAIWGLNEYGFWISPGGAPLWLWLVLACTVAGDLWVASANVGRLVTIVSGRDKPRALLREEFVTPVRPGRILGL